VSGPPPGAVVVAARLYPVILLLVKTAISVPDDTFARVERRARMLGITRSQFYTHAAQRYLEQLDAETLAGQIDAALDMIGAAEPGRGGLDEATELATAAGRRLLSEAGEDDW